MKYCMMKESVEQEECGIPPALYNLVTNRN